MKILIVSEENGERASLVGYRLRAGPDVVNTTIDAYREVLERGEFSVILVDSHSTGSDILDVCRDIRTVSSQPLLLLTRDSSESFHLSAYAADVDECVVRPIGAELLEAKVNAWRRWSSPTAERATQAVKGHSAHDPSDTIRRPKRL